MTFHRMSAVFLLISCFLALSGCQNPEPAVSETPQIVTDEAFRAQLWEDYLGDAIGNIGNIDWASPQEADSPVPFVHYVLCRMAAQGEVDIRDGQLILPPLAVVKEQLVRYFDTDLGLTEEDYAEIYTQYSGDAEQGFLYWSHSAASYEECVDGEDRLGEVTYDEARGVYQADMWHIANRKTDRVDLIRRFTLGQRDNGELYFVSHRWQYPPLPEGLATVSGNFTELSRLTAFLNERPDYTVQSAGAFGGQLLIQLRAFEPDSLYRRYCLFTYQPETDAVLAQYEFTETAGHLFSGLRRQGDRMLLRFTDGWCYLDEALEAGPWKPLPEAVAAHMSQEPEWAGCYDIGQDGASIYYLRDKMALWRYDDATQTSRRLFQRANLDFNGSYGLFDLMLSPNEETLVMTLAGYDGPIGCYIVPLRAPTEGQQIRPAYDFLLDWSNNGQPMPLMGSNGRCADSAAPWTIQPLDGPASPPFSIDLTGDQRLDDISRDDCLLYNDRYTVYTVTHNTGGSPEDATYALVRVDLQTHAAQTMLSTKACAITPLAITEDGRVLFSCRFEQEFFCGICR